MKQTALVHLFSSADLVAVNCRFRFRRVAVGHSRAAAELAEARRLGATYSTSIARAKKTPMGWPKIRALSEDTYFAGLRKAGMPEE